MLCAWSDALGHKAVQVPYIALGIAAIAHGTGDTAAALKALHTTVAACLNQGAQSEALVRALRLRG